MAVNYKIYQNPIESSSTYNKFYARAVMTGTVDTRTVGAKIANNVSAKTSDVVGMLRELSEVIHDALCEGNCVHLDGLGYFYPKITSTATDTAAEIREGLRKNIKRISVRFKSENTRSSNGKTVRKLAGNTRVQELTQYANLVSEEGTDSKSTSDEGGESSGD